MKKAPVIASDAPGQPLILRIDEKRWQVIVGMHAVNASNRQVADVCRISRPTLRRWMEEGAEILEEYDTFSEVPEEPRERWLMAKLVADCRESSGTTGVKLQQIALETAKANPNFLQWYLKTKYRDSFGDDVQRIEVTTKEVTPAVAAALNRKIFGEVGPEPEDGTT